MSRFVRQLKKDWPAVEHAVAKRLEQWSQRRAHQSIEYVEGGKSTEEPALSSFAPDATVGRVNLACTKIQSETKNLPLALLMRLGTIQTC